MKVLHLNAGNLFGGVESMLVTMARERACNAELQPEFAVCFEGRFARDLAAQSVPVHLLGPVSVRRPWSVWRARRRLEQVLRAGGFAAIVSHGCWVHGLAGPVARSAGVRSALFLHDRVHSGHWVERWALSSPPDVVLANSRFTRSSAAGLFRDREVAVVHPPVAAPPAPAPGARERVRSSLGASDDAFVLLMTCRLEPWKGHKLLLQALAHLADRPGWTCWIAGGPQRPAEQSYLEELRAHVRAAGLSNRVSWLGQRSDVPELLAAADVHCQPNVGPEPFGVAFVEALWSKVPVVTTALGGALEVIDDTCGVLVPPGDPDALARTLADLMERPEAARRLGAAGPDRARTLCDPSAQLASLQAALSRPAPAGAPRPRTPGWVALVGSVARRLPRGRYEFHDLAYRVVTRARRVPPPFLAHIDAPSGALRFVCDLRDDAAREVCFTGKHELQARPLIERLLRPGNTFVDVGAGWGYLTLIAASAVGPTGRVIALEPDRRMLELLRENVRVNHLDQVTCHTTSDAPRLDGVLDGLGVRGVDLLRLDLRAAGPQGLEGVRRGFTERRYAAVLLEDPGELNESCSIDAVCRLLEEVGYVLRPESNIDPRRHHLWVPLARGGPT